MISIGSSFFSVIFGLQEKIKNMVMNLKKPLNTNIKKKSPKKLPRDKNSINPFTLRFYNLQLEDDYKKERHKKNRGVIKIVLISWCMLLIFGLMLASYFLKGDELFFAITYRFYVFFISLGLFIFTRSSYYIDWWQIVCVIAIVIMSPGYFYAMAVANEDYLYVPYTAIQLIILFGFLLGIKFFYMVFISIIMSFFYIISLVFNQNISNIYSWIGIIGIFIYYFIIMLIGYSIEFLLRENYLGRIQIQQEESKRRTAEQKRILWLENITHFLRHEMGNRLSGVRLSLQLIGSQEVGTAISPHLERAVRGTDFMNYLLERAVEASTIEANFSKDHHVPLNLSVIVAQNMNDYKQSFPNVSFIVQCELSVRIIGHEIRLSELIDKLIQNALEFHDKGTPIVIILTRDKWSAVLLVKNEGPLLLEPIGNLFELSSSVRYRQEGHMGLGLYIAKLIAERHGGNISARNSHSPAGAEFSVRLPYL